MRGSTMRGLQVAALLIACLVSSALSADAATLIGPQGQVLVNSGDGYKPAIDNMELKPGDSVIANPGASAQIVYADGTIVPVQPGSVVTIAENGALGAGLTTGGLEGSTLVVGGLAIAGGVGLAIGLSGGSDKPASGQ